MKTFLKLMAWILGNLITVPLVLVVSLHYWTAAVKDEYRTGVRVSTDADTVMIPAMEYVFVWISFLLALNLILLTIWAIRRYRRLRPGNSSKQTSSASCVNSGRRSQ